MVGDTVNRIAAAFIAIAIPLSLAMSGFAAYQSIQPAPRLELSVASMHQEGAWLRVDEASGYEWQSLTFSHPTQRLHVKGEGVIVPGEHWWVNATCGTGNIYSIATNEDYFVTAITFTLPPCPKHNALSELL